MIAGKQMLAAVAALLVCAWIWPAHASAETILVDGDDPVLDAGCGAPENPCNTIQAGIDAAGEDDTVSVATAAAPYAEAVTIAKEGIKLVGPGEGVAGSERGAVADLSRDAVIDAPDEAPAAVTVTAGGVRVEGFFLGGGGTGIALDADDAEVRSNVFADLAPAVSLAGREHLVVQNLFVQKAGDAPVYGVMAATAADGAAIRFNRFEGDRQAIALSGDAVSVEANTVDAEATDAGTLVALRGGANVLVRGNTLAGGLAGLALSGVQGAAVESNSITGAGARGISVELAPELPPGKALLIARNQVVGNGLAPGGIAAAGILFEAGSLADDPLVVANRFSGQAANGVPGVRVEATDPGRRVVAANNWWGCNGGPGAVGCDSAEVASDASSVVTSPRLVLSAAATPSVVFAPGAFRLSAGIQRNSAGLEVPEIALLDPLPFRFSYVLGAAVITERVSLGGGAAQASLESAAPGRAVVRAALDAAAVDVAVYFSPEPVAPASPGTTGSSDTKIPRLRNLSAARTARGSTFRFTLSEPAVVRFVLARTERGRTSGLRCLALRRASRCTRRIPAGSFSMSGIAGSNARPFFGRVGKRRLRPGVYRATLVATDAAGNAGTPKRVAFEIGPR